jgi:gliding motility-associated-like protein
MYRHFSFILFCLLLFMPLGMSSQSNIVSSYKWDGLSAPTYTFVAQANKCYQVVISGYVRDPDNGGYRDAFFSFDSTNNAMLKQEGLWLTKNGAFTSLQPNSPGYNSSHTYEFNYRVCSGGPQSFTFDYQDVNFANNNGSSITIDWYELTPCNATAPSIDLGADKTSCTGDAVTLDAANTNSGATYVWSTGATTQTIHPTTSGMYKVTVSSFNCTVSDSVKVTLFPELKADKMITSVPPCNQNAGEVVLSGQGGKQPYQYSIDGGTNFSGNPTFNNLSAGVYPAIIKDALGCDDTILVIIDNPTNTDIDTVNYTPVLCQSDKSGFITISVAGAASPFTYQWTGTVNSNSQNLSGIGPGGYIITVTDNNQCKVSEVFSIAQNDPPTLIAYKKDVKCGGQSTGSISVQVDGNSAPYTYSWTGPSTGNTKDLSNIPKGVYTLTVTDKNGCTSSATATVTEPPPLQLTSAVTPVCGSPTAGAINITVTGGMPGYTYEWSGNITATTQNVSGLTTGNYFVTVKDQLQCDVSASFDLTNFDLTFATSGCPQLGSVNIDLTVSRGTPPYNFQWSNGANTEDISNLGEGVYSVQVTDANQCYGDGSTTVTAENTPCIIIPTVFTPNGDNINDVWTLKGIEHYSILRKSKYETPWDGKDNGMDLPTASYYYVIELNDGHIVYKGYVTIKR